MSERPEDPREQAEADGPPDPGTPDPAFPGTPMPLPAGAGGPTVAPSPTRALVRALLGPVVFGGLLLLKFGKVAFVAIKGVKFFATAATMLVSIAAYSVIFGLPFAAGIVLLLLVHEMGHAIQLKREGIDAGAPVFIPFLGAAIAMKELPRDAAMEARVGIAGPVLGSAGAALVHVMAIVTGSELLLAVAFTGYFLNLFNLVPVSPLDGGRIAASLEPRLWVAGIVALAAMFLLWPNPVLLLIVIVGGLDSWRRLRDHDPEHAYYRDVPAGFRIAIGASWVSLVVLLVLAMQATHVPRTL